MPQAQLAWVRSSTSHELRTEKPPSSIQNAMACGCGGTPQARAARMLPRQALEPHYLGAVNELLRLGFPGGPAGGGLGDRLGRLEPFGADRFSRGLGVVSSTVLPLPLVRCPLVTRKGGGDGTRPVRSSAIVAPCMI